MAQQCADDARARAPPRKRVCMHVLTLSLSLSPPLSRLPPSHLALSLLHPCAWHTRRLAEQNPDGIVELQGCCIDREGSSTLLPLLAAARIVRACVHAAGRGERGGPADTHASPLSSVYAIRYRRVGTLDRGGWEGDVEDS